MNKKTNDPSSPTANSGVPEQAAEMSRSVQRMVRRLLTVIPATSDIRDPNTESTRIYLSEERELPWIDHARDLHLVCLSPSERTPEHIVEFWRQIEIFAHEEYKRLPELFRCVVGANYRAVRVVLKSTLEAELGISYWGDKSPNDPSSPTAKPQVGNQEAEKSRSVQRPVS